MITDHSVSTAPPVWLRWFVNDALRGVIDRAAMAPLGCHFYHDEEMDVWEITLFISRTEVCGGRDDGQRVPTGLQIDTLAVCKAFDKTPAVYWQSESIAEDDQLGNHLSFEGTARGFSVWLRILQKAPDIAGTGRMIDAHSGSIRNLW